jgi:hypothetical protein
VTLRKRTEVIGGDIQFDVTDMTEAHFLALFNETSPVPSDGSMCRFRPCVPKWLDLR